MGGQETLLLVAEHMQMLAGAAALDSATNLAARYAAFRKLPNGIGLQRLARLEFGGIPRTRHDAYADRALRSASAGLDERERAFARQLASQRIVTPRQVLAPAFAASVLPPQRPIAYPI